MARHRLEDLGRLLEKLNQAVDHEIFFLTEARFRELMKNEDRVEEHFAQLQNLRNDLFILMEIAAGNDALNEEPELPCRWNH